MKEPIFEVGYNNHGEMDFGVRGTIINLNYDQMRRLREMIVVGIGVLEDSWRHSHEKCPVTSIERERT